MNKTSSLTDGASQPIVPDALIYDAFLAQKTTLAAAHLCLRLQHFSEALNVCNIHKHTAGPEMIPKVPNKKTFNETPKNASTKSLIKEEGKECGKKLETL